MQEKWKQKLPYIEQNISKKTLQEMAEELNVENKELRLFLHHHRKFKVSTKCNLVIRLLTEIVKYPEYFQPTQQFYKATGIGQRRWWQLYKGEKRITEREYRAICNHLKVDNKMALNVRQLDIFENVL